MKPEQQIVAMLRSVPEVERVYLFGSRARGDHRPRADLDVAISCPTATERQWLKIWDLIEDTETLLAIDLVRLEDVSADLKTRILAEGRVIYERS